MPELLRVRSEPPERQREILSDPPVGESTEVALPLSHYIWLLKWRRWQIAGFVALSLLATWVVSNRLTPLFEATATINVDRQMPSSAVGETAGAQAPSAADADQFLATQTRLIESDSVVRPVAERFHLPASDLEALPDAPVRLKNLTVSRPPNTYLLEVRYRSQDRRLAADVANAIADSYLEHYYRIRIDSSERLGTYMTGQLESLRARMERSSQHLADFERVLNVVNPDQKTTIASASLMQLNTAYNSAREERLKKEAAWDAMRSGSLDAALASTQGGALAKLIESLDEARLNLARASSRLGENHPEFRNLKAQVAELERQIAERRASIAERVKVEFDEAVDRENMARGQLTEIRAEFDRLNAGSFGYQTLKTEAEADRRLYDELVRRIREAGINASFQDSAIRIADRARPPARPVFPRLWMNLAAAFILSIVLAVGGVIVRDLADNTIRDPDEASRLLRVPVTGALPAVGGLRRLRERRLIAADDSTAGTAYIEAVRTLRNAVLLTDFNSQLRTILVTSASPAEGKTTVAGHLALAHAEKGNRTLLIDADLRRPSLHGVLGEVNEKGLSDVFFNGGRWQDVVRPAVVCENLHFLAAGSRSRRAADMAGKKLQPILEEAVREYDLVILDSPPLVGFPEPLEMAASVDGVLVVARAGHTDRKAVASVVAMLNLLRANIAGVVLNEVTPGMSNSYHHYYQYSRYYESDRAVV